MSRTITVKGIGQAITKPDYIELSLKVTAKNEKYDDTMSKSADMLNELKKAAAVAGFSESDLKTAAFNLNTHYENEHDGKGMYKRVFKGFICEHDLKLEFALDMAKLQKIFAALSVCACSPQLSVRFTVKDKEALKNEILRKAVQNAKNRAEVLALSSGVILKELLSVDYSLNNLQIHSPTVYNRAVALQADSSFSERTFEINPEEIKTEDCVTLVWAIGEN